MNSASLIFCVGEDFSHCFQHVLIFVAYDQLHPFKPTSFQPLEEADATGLVLFRALCCAQDLQITVLIDRDRHQYSHVFILAAPIPAQIDAVSINAS